MCEYIQHKNLVKIVNFTDTQEHTCTHSLTHTCMTSAMVDGLSAYGQQIALWSTVTAVLRDC